MLLAPLLLVARDAQAAGPVRRWSAEIAEASGRFSIPEEWIRRVIGIESGGRASAGGRPLVSPAGAIGLMQLMPGTWRDMRMVLSLGPDPNDPRDNILAGSLYLRLMYDRFGYPGLFAAYNAGPARYGAVLRGERRLPRETRAYVARVTGAGLASAARAVDPSPLFVLGPRPAAGPGPQERALPARALFVGLGAGRF